MVFPLLKKKNVRPPAFLTIEEAFKIQGIIDWKDYSSKERLFLERVAIFSFTKRR